jgi:hypothetical protein
MPYVAKTLYIKNPYGLYYNCYSSAVRQYRSHCSIGPRLIADGNVVIGIDAYFTHISLRNRIIAAVIG